MSGEIRSRKKNKQKSKRKASSQSVQDYEDELLSGSPEVQEDEDDESKYYTAHVDEAAEFEEEDEDQGTGCLYKIVFVFLLIILGGIATIVLVDDTQVSGGSNHQGGVSHGEVHLGEQGVHGEQSHGGEEGGVIVEEEPMLGSIDVSEFVERVLNSFRLEDMFSEPGHEHDEAHEGEEEGEEEEHGHDDEEHDDEGDNEQDDEDQGDNDEDDQDQTEVGENNDDDEDDNDQAVGDDNEDANDEDQQDTNEDEDEEQQVPAPVEVVEAPVLEEQTQEEEDQVEEPVQVQEPEEQAEAFYNPPTYDQVAPERVYEEPEEEEEDELPSPVQDEILDEEESFPSTPSPDTAQQETAHGAPSQSEYAYSYRQETPSRHYSGEDVYTDFQQV